GAGGSGTLYLLFLKPCDFIQEPGNNHWNGGNTLFTNWSHASQMLTSDSLTFEQCTFKAFETDAAYMTYNFNDGRCICKDSTATLTVSTELSTAFTNTCFSGNVTSLDEDRVSLNQVSIYPNPTSTSINIVTTQMNFSQEDRIDLLSLTGKLIYSQDFNSKNTTIDLSLLPAGVYVLNVISNNKNTSYKVIKK
ncbi:T9SS type A sorting domain-containing protein, partial [Flavobacteriales bacterium]|nr:T9SS type A sorting domain-containing protein [Flavobacteriales bacterium]